MTPTDRLTEATANMERAKKLRSEALVHKKKVHVATEKVADQLIELLQSARTEAEAASEVATDKYFEAEAEFVKAHTAIGVKKND